MSGAPANRSAAAIPDLRQTLRQTAQRVSAGTNCHRIGTIVAFDAATQSATVQLVDPVVVYNTPMTGTAPPAKPTTYPIPPLVQVPVFVLCGGTAFLGMPIAAGDTCVVLFNDRDLDPWWTNGTTGAIPNSDRMHSLADGIALVGIRPATKPIAGLPTDGQHIALGNASGTFKAAMTLLFQALTSWTNTDSSTPEPATIAAITTAQQAFNAIFQ